jgi:hypothetical protein
VKHLPALTVAFLALVGIAVLFFAAAYNTQAQPQQTSPFSITGQAQALYENGQTGLASSSSPLAAASSYRVVISVLDKDQDHDGNYDAIADPLAGLALGSVVLVMVLGVGALAGVRLLLAFHEPQKLSSVWLTAWEERPG